LCELPFLAKENTTNSGHSRIRMFSDGLGQSALVITALSLIVGGHVGLDALHPVVAENHDDAPKGRDVGIFVAFLLIGPW
jgi:hypothetical protein